jgi:hypothetical protein
MSSYVSRFLLPVENKKMACFKISISTYDESIIICKKVTKAVFPQMDYQDGACTIPSVQCRQ